MDAEAFFVFLCTVCFRRVPCPLVVLSVFKTTVDVTSRILSVAPCNPSGTIHPGRDRPRDDVGEGMADGKRRQGEKELCRNLYPLFQLIGKKKNRCILIDSIVLGGIASKEKSTVILFICTLSSIERRGNNKLINTLLAY